MAETHVWNERLDLGHEAIDHEHHLQIGLLSAFIEAAEAGRPSLARRFVDELLSYSVVHFSSEEWLMESAGFAGRIGHATSHAELLQRMRELRQALGEGLEGPALTSAIELRADLAAHMDEADRILVHGVQPRGQGTTEGVPSGTSP